MSDAISTLTRSSLVRWIAGGSALAALLAVVAVHVWPASEADKARDDGEKVGEAVTQLYEAASSADVDAALSELDAAVADTRAHATGEVALDDLYYQADDFRGQGPEVHQAFWQGVDDGLSVS